VVEINEPIVSICDFHLGSHSAGGPVGKFKSIAVVSTSGKEFRGVRKLLRLGGLSASTVECKLIFLLQSDVTLGEVFLVVRENFLNNWDHVDAGELEVYNETLLLEAIFHAERSSNFQYFNCGVLLDVVQGAFNSVQRFVSFDMDANGVKTAKNFVITGIQTFRSVLFLQFLVHFQDSSLLRSVTELLVLRFFDGFHFFDFLWDGDDAGRAGSRSNRVLREWEELRGGVIFQLWADRALDRNGWGTHGDKGVTRRRNQNAIAAEALKILWNLSERGTIVK